METVKIKTVGPGKKAKEIVQQLSFSLPEVSEVNGKKN